MGDDLKKLADDIDGFNSETDYRIGDLASGPKPAVPGAPEPPAAPAAPAADGAEAPPAAPQTPRRPLADADDEADAPLDRKQVLEEFKRQQGLSSGSGPEPAAMLETQPEAAASDNERHELLKLHKPDFGAEEEAAVLAVLRSGWLTKGPRVVDFEQAFAKRVAAPHALGLNSATAALHTALIAAGIRAGDEVIVPAMTFAATANVVVHCGGTPVFADALAGTHCIDPAHAASLVTPRTRAIVPVHFAGIPCDMAPLWELAAKHDLFILEDCAHAVETEYKGIPVGTAHRADTPTGGSRFAAYSFYATKNLITGEGGMLTCADATDLENSRVASLHGMSVDAWKRYAGADGAADAGDFKLYDIVAAGFKYNMFELQAALGLVQLKKLDANWERRRDRVKQYDTLLAQAFPNGEVTGLTYPDYGKSAHHLYIARVSEELAGARDNIIRGLRRRKVEAYLHYICLTGTQFYRERFSTSPKQTPVAQSIADRSITLPLFPTMTEGEVEFVVAMLKQAFAEAQA